MNTKAFVFLFMALAFALMGFGQILSGWPGRASQVLFFVAIALFISATVSDLYPGVLREDGKLSKKG